MGLVITSRRRRALLSAPRSEVTCSLCGLAFDPAANPACPSCPLSNGCTIVCCPRCGHDTVDPARSALVQLGVRLCLLLRSNPTPAAATPGPQQEPSPRTLADLRPGDRALVRGLEGLEHERRERLQAYGLVPGRHVHVVQHAPVTVVQVEHTHVAFESHLARGIEVEPIAATG